MGNTLFRNQPTNTVATKRQWYTDLNEIASDIQEAAVNKKKHTSGGWVWNDHSYDEETVGEYIYKQLSNIVYTYAQRQGWTDRWQVDTFNCGGPNHPNQVGDINKG